MLNRRLLEIISRLSPMEIKRLRQFIHSPYFTYGISSQEVIRLFDYIVSYGADEENPALDKSTASRKLFPDKDFHEKSKNPIDTLTSDLMRLTKKFLFIESIEQTYPDPIQDLALARSYRKFGLEERYWQLIEQIRKQMYDLKVRDSAFYFHQFRLETEVMHFKSLYNSSEDDANLHLANRYLEQFFAMNRLDKGCALEYQNIMASFEQELSSGLYTVLLEQLKQGHYQSEPAIQIYELVHHLIHHPEDEAALRDFEQFLDQHKSGLDAEQCNDMHAYLRNFYLRSYIKSGSPDTLAYLFQLMTQHLRAGYMYTDGKVMGAALRNLTRAGLRLGARDEVLHILKDHPPERITGTQFPEEFYNLNLAEYYFALKDYEQSLQTLVYKNFEDINFSIHADMLLLKIYYETQSSLLDPRMKALAQKVRRSKMAAERKQRYNNFLSKLDKLCKYAWDKKSERRQKLVEEIKSTDSIVEREWLLAQLQ